MKGRSNLKKMTKKSSYSCSQSKSTQIILEACKALIKDPLMRKQTVSFIKAVDGKKIRNTSGV